MASKGADTNVLHIWLMDDRLVHKKVVRRKVFVDKRGTHRVDATNGRALTTTEPPVLEIRTTSEATPKGLRMSNGTTNVDTRRDFPERGGKSECSVCGWKSRHWATLHEAGCEATWHVFEEHPEEWLELFGPTEPTDPDPR